MRAPDNWLDGCMSIQLYEVRIAAVDFVDEVEQYFMLDLDDDNKKR